MVLIDFLNKTFSGRGAKKNFRATQEILPPPWLKSCVPVVGIIIQIIHCFLIVHKVKIEKRKFDLVKFLIFIFCIKVYVLWFTYRGIGLGTF